MDVEAPVKIITAPCPTARDRGSRVNDLVYLRSAWGSN